MEIKQKNIELQEIYNVAGTLSNFVNNTWLWIFFSKALFQILWKAIYSYIDLGGIEIPKNEAIRRQREKERERKRDLCFS
jgi:hypothetical protein